MAVTVILALNVTVQLTVLTEVHPDHEENLLLPTVAGAVSMNVEPAPPVSVKLVVPVVMTLLRRLPTPIVTPLAGLVEFTVSM